ncbi:AlpA family phage regulatory protein [Rhodanobacter sp. DHG33]|uniref:helix-turn-helix transcriptional regulator n=1 Tax=Rhodanobacter sp. DHG33 TaxID=2775921 RepID=UPI00177FB1EB|nr:AlpA family phage regulatory protein [Rhodanobacter sp. DHG33]MBD8898573.1 AlpA family phage regulatory protein [Rhodanobacter sp. DHG33]
MKRSKISPQAISLHPRVALGEASAPRDHSLSNAFPNVTLSDIYQKLVELLIETAKQKVSRKAIRLPDVKEITGESRSQIYARMNSKYAAYDETWPLPFYIGKSPRWWLHEIEAWLDGQAASTEKAHG